MNDPHEWATAFCKDESRDIAYLRFYNAAPNPCEAELTLGFDREIQSVSLVNLKGDALPDQQSLQLGGGFITLQVRPAQIVTIALQL